ncbi:HAD family hydrolase [Stutzerimonas stutzeri]|uniref:phosphoglycolate phosphatase n=1 Tax=Stutzerimonas stutzeri TaxID=316 RepID=A0ABD4XXL4_STUST|nr:HAD family hydrolase [Stutzerimonas stutzeri]MDH0687608.1 HAD hydrolase-like protein [Stutzerimonas stutzeri]OPG82721.1 HAD family hydrolase [Stutzerimonas stutzeri]
MNLSAYRSIVFDCDGVILDSNRVKTDAFYNATLPYGEKAAEAMVDYHVRNGGISRYRKFAYFLEHLAPAGVPGPDLQALLAAYATEVKTGLLACEVAGGLEAFRKHTGGTRWMVASGGDQAELRELFEARGLLDWFDGGIFGSPDTKEEIVKRELENGNVRMPALFIGDSRYDHQVAHENGLDFVFLSRWSEFAGWKDYFAAHDTTIKSTMKDLFAQEEGSN